MNPTTAADILDENVTPFANTTSVDDAIDEIRRSASGSKHTIYYAYVVDEDETLEGVVSLRELLNADDDATVTDVATAPVVSVNESAPADRVTTVFTRNEFVALPVVDDAGAFSGVVRANDVIEALDETASKQVLREMIHDVEYDPNEESAYECFDCGRVVTAADNPGECHNCGGDIRHRQTTIE